MTHFIKGIGPACPECGCVKSRRIGNGWSDPDDHYLRYKRCEECGAKFVTVEALVPLAQTTFYRLDHAGRTWRREYYRRRYAKTTKRNAQNMRDGDELSVTVRVHARPKLTCGRGHPCTPENTLVTGRCRLCRKAQDHDYYVRRRREAAA